MVPRTVRSRFSPRVPVSLAPLLIGLLAGCATIPFDPAPVVPTKHQFPYSVRLKLGPLGAFLVEPGATMIADPGLQNHVLSPVDSLVSPRERWEAAILQYVTARQTFRRVIKEGTADLDLELQVAIYIDPSRAFDFNYIYAAGVDAFLKDPRNGRLLKSYSGFGKAVGEVARGGKDDDKQPVNRALHAALNDLFGKMEHDRRLASL